jgi:hypothetical protein
MFHVETLRLRLPPNNPIFKTFPVERFGPQNIPSFYGNFAMNCRWQFARQGKRKLFAEIGLTSSKTRFRKHVS